MHGNFGNVITGPHLGTCRRPAEGFVRASVLTVEMEQQC